MSTVQNPYYECSECCDCDNLKNNVSQLNVSISGAITASGTISKASPPHSGECITFFGDLFPTGTCGGVFLFVSVKVLCYATEGKDKWDIRLLFGAAGGNCGTAPENSYHPQRPNDVTCDPFDGTWTYRTDDAIPGGCPCGDNQLITINVTE